MAKNIILIQTNELNRSLVELYENIQKVDGKAGQVKVLWHCENAHSEFESSIPEDALIRFNHEDIRKLNIPFYREGIVPGCNHYPLYFLQNILGFQHDYFWLIEYDVRFSGAWSDFFTHFDAIDSDLLCSHLKKFRAQHQWRWWPLHNKEISNFRRIQKRARIRGFLPVMRLSKRALQFLYAQQLSGWKGHSEVLIPTLLKRKGFSIRDIGGDGEFVHEGERNLFFAGEPWNVYSAIYQSSMRFRPVHEGWGETPNMLYHPVKD